MVRCLETITVSLFITHLLLYILLNVSQIVVLLHLQLYDIASDFRLLLAIIEV